MRTFTVFCMSPAETTTALMVRCAVRVAMTGWWRTKACDCEGEGIELSENLAN